MIDRTYGNVSRTHRPCGACGALVESCVHWHPAPVRTPGRRYSRRELARANATRLKREQTELMRSLGYANEQLNLGPGGRPRKDKS